MLSATIFVRDEGVVPIWVVIYSRVVPVYIHRFTGPLHPAGMTTPTMVPVSGCDNLPVYVTQVMEDVLMCNGDLQWQDLLHTT